MNKSNGFTLLELLISLSILAVIVVMISASLRVGIRAWEKGEQNVEFRQRQRIVLDMMRRQMVSLRLKGFTHNEKEIVSLKGDEKSLTFLSNKAMIPDNTFGPVYVRYAVNQAENDTERLMLYETNFVLLDKDADIEHPSDKQFYELIPEARNISFEYLKKKEEGLEWQPSWDPEADSGVPMAIRIVFKKDEDAAPVHVIARIEQKDNS